MPKSDVAHAELNGTSAFGGFGSGVFSNPEEVEESNGAQITYGPGLRVRAKKGQCHDILYNSNRHCYFWYLWWIISVISLELAFELKWVAFFSFLACQRALFSVQDERLGDGA